MRHFLFVMTFLVGITLPSQGYWGFFGHRLITEMAIYTLPPEMAGFYKKNSRAIIEKSVVPDQRRYVIPEEGPRHYIDLDVYGEEYDSLPKYWRQAVEKFGEDSLTDHGIVPWHAYFTYRQLVKAFANKDQVRIINKSSDLAHYLADANVPLHTTSNYNGQKTGQKGIHGFWETRLPQLFSNDYDFLVGQANYLSDPQQAIWDGVLGAHHWVDSILVVEKRVSEEIGESKKYSFEDNGKRTVKVYSKKFSLAYHNALPIVELQMQKSIKLIGDFWFTAWIEAGQPDLNTLHEVMIEKPDSTNIIPVIIPQREHEH
ncbi:MAG: zinc dependent phospholipase C family protein [Bacteroidota bacterium]